MITKNSEVVFSWLLAKSVEWPLLDDVCPHTKFESFLHVCDNSLVMWTSFAEVHMPWLF